MSPFADILSCKWVKKCWRCAVISSAVSTCLVGYMFWLRIKKKRQKGTLRRKKKNKNKNKKRRKNTVNDLNLYYFNFLSTFQHVFLTFQIPVYINTRVNLFLLIENCYWFPDVLRAKIFYRQIEGKKLRTEWAFTFNIGIWWFQFPASAL